MGLNDPPGSKCAGVCVVVVFERRTEKERKETNWNIIDRNNGLFFQMVQIRFEKV